MNLKRVTFTELVLKGVMLFAIFTIVQSLAIFEGVNRIWTAVISLALLARLLTYRYSRMQMLMLALTVIVHIFAILLTEFPMYSANMLFYFLLWVMLYVFFAKSKLKLREIMRHADRYINGILWIWTALVGISAMLPGSYEGSYFVSFSGSSFRLMPAVLIITALAMYMAIKQKNWRYNLFLLLPTYAAFMNSSRTYFAVYILFLLMYIYMQFRSKRQFYMVLIPLLGVIVALMSVSGIADKLESTQYTDKSYFDFWGTVTSGRSVFWLWDLEAFFDLPFLQQFVGNGFNFVYDVNGAHMSKIWAHNDIINILMNFGYIGVIIYFWAYLQMIKVFWPKDSKVPLFVKLMFHGAVFINSMMNMSYTYLCAMIAYPLFLFVVDMKEQQVPVELPETGTIGNREI